MRSRDLDQGIRPSDEFLCGFPFSAIHPDQMGTNAQRHPHKMSLSITPEV